MGRGRPNGSRAPPSSSPANSSIDFPLARSFLNQATSPMLDASTANTEVGELNPVVVICPLARYTSDAWTTSGISLTSSANLPPGLVEETPLWRSLRSAPAAYRDLSFWLSSNVELKALPMTPRAVANVSNTIKIPGTIGSRATWRRACTNHEGANGPVRRDKSAANHGNIRMTIKPTANSPRTGPNSRL